MYVYLYVCDMICIYIYVCVLFIYLLIYLYLYIYMYMHRLSGDIQGKTVRHVISWLKLYSSPIWAWVHSI